MDTLFKKSVILICSVIVFIVQQAKTQESCYNCSLDSISGALNRVKTDPERVKLLTLRIDLRVSGVGSESGIKSDSLVLDDVQMLIELSKSQKVKDINAYKSLSDGIHFLQKKDYIGAQNSFKESISLFDKTHKKVPHLIASIRYIYNLAGNQEERLRFYSEKLIYYLTNGPVENTAPCYHGIGGYYLFKADYNKSISNYLKAAAIYKTFEKKAYQNDLGVIATTYSEWGNNEKALEYFNKAIPLMKQESDISTLSFVYINLSEINRKLKNLDKALQYCDSALVVNQKHLRNYEASAFLEKAFTDLDLKQPKEGFENLNAAKKIIDAYRLKVYSASGAIELDFGYFRYYSAGKNIPEAGKFLNSAYEKSVEVGSNKLQLKYLRELSLFYAQLKNSEKAHFYSGKYFMLSDELEKEHSSFNIAQYENEEKEIQQNDSINVLKQQAILQAATLKTNKSLLWGSLLAVLLISISMFFVYRQYRINRKTLLSLRKTQRQLVASEKMASLGELTAGIAHEIQNPLNFVNNFSDVSNELVDEMKDELAVGNLQLANEIADNVKLNLEKILHHGKRADAIVKGMLQHSRSSSGVKESTNINALADEYFRLAYHGLRAKDKEFNATLKTDFDESIGNANIVPQDIGRVILNLITNAFYAVTEKKKQLETGYEPTVSLNTAREGNTVIISVKDNGNGIPQKAMDKIFQPFFTTKPAGQGTGLGLSMSYDIIKVHGGEMKVETKEGEFTIFMILIPV